MAAANGNEDTLPTTATRGRDVYVLPAVVGSLARARAVARAAGLRAGLSNRKVETLQVAVGELALASIVATDGATSLRLTLRPSGRGVRVTGGVAGATTATTLHPVQRALLEGLGPRFGFSADEHGTTFELFARRSGSLTHLPSRDEEGALFVEYRCTGDPDLRNVLAEAHHPIAVQVAQRYRHPGEPFDDLLQVASLAVLKAVERFDPERGLRFSTFATATIDGELKRYFRDSTWTVRVPRADQELHLQLREATTRLTQELGRAPEPADLADALGVPEPVVRRGLAVTAARAPTTIDRPDREEGGWTGRRDPGMARVDDRDVVQRMLARLSPRDRRIVELRYFGEWSQSDIAAEVGVSQMHVSRILSRVVADLRVRAAGAGSTRV